jgi:carbon-monoxide dehydrogenase large subunit
VKILKRIYDEEDRRRSGLSQPQVASEIAIQKVERFVGRPMKRKEDAVLVAGHGTYVDDIKLPGMLYLGILRSEYAHARIRSVDLSGAMSTPGVVLALDGEEVAKKTKPLPLTVSLPWMRRTDVYMLAVGKVHYTGDPVAAVLATDRFTVEDALEKVQVDYEPIGVVTDAEGALQPDAPRLYEGWDSNEMIAYHFKAGDPEEALQSSDHVIREKIVRHRYTGAPIETRGYVASYDQYSKFLTYYASIQTPHILRTLISKSIEIPEDRIRVIAPHVGGGFGQKIPLYQEEPLVAYLSVKTGKPVKWIESRTENLRASAHSRQQIHHIEVGLKRDGTITAIRDRMIADLGAYAPQSGLASVLATTLFIPSGYRVRNYDIDLHVVQTNKAPYGALRGFGKADANFVMERVLDIAARKFAFDPVELRLKNFLQPQEFPYTSCTGAIYDSGNYPEVLKMAAEEIGYAEFRSKQRELWKKGVYKGISVSFMIEPSANAVPDSLHTGYDSATVRIDPSGRITVMAGVAAQGQGHETSLSQVVADELGVEPDDVTVMEGDSAVSPYGLGAWASRFSIAGVGSVVLACRKVRKKLTEIAATVLKVPEEDIVTEGGRLYSQGDRSKSISIEEVAEIAYTKIYKLPPGVEPGIEETARYVIPNINYIPDEVGRMNLYPSETAGAYSVIVDVDVETGKVKIERQVFVSDAGNIINPLLLEGQIHGGIAHGIGGALFEDLVYDSDGHLLSSTFIDYLLPTALEVPDVTVLHSVTPSPVTLGGFKGAGEGGCIPPPYGITSAVEDALAPIRAMMSKQPLSPENVWGATKADAEKRK